MRSALSHAVFAVALRSLPAERREWGNAMVAEMDDAANNREALGFATGCLSAAIRIRMPRPLDQFAAARLFVAIGMILPVAVFHFGCAMSGMKLMIAGQDHYSRFLLTGADAQQAMAAQYVSLAPILTLFLLALSFWHIIAAWQLVRWRPDLLLIAMITALTITVCLAIAIATVTSGWTGLAIQFAGITAEMLALPLFLAWSGKVGAR